MSEFDYVIVGAGSAGAVIANRLTEDPKASVLLLEAGEWSNEILMKMPLGAHLGRHPQLNWGYMSEEIPFLGRPLPPEIQAVTVFSAGIGARSDHPAETQALIAFLTSPEADAIKREQGMEPAREA